MSDWRRPLVNPCGCGCGVMVAKNFKKGHSRRRPLLDRLMTKVDKSDECWLWTGAVCLGGYGRIGTGPHAVSQTHRVAYELFVGPIPDGLHIDHLCRVRRCIRPEHLEAVTQAENNQRAWDAKKRLTTGARP